MVDVFFDDTPVLHVRGFEYQAGRVGFLVERGALELRNFAIAVPTPEAESITLAVTMPQVEREVKPKYTPEARQAGVQGEVWLKCVVLPDGTVGDVTVVRSLRPDLDANAIAAAKKWRFRPGTRNGKPVAVSVTISMSFTLRQ